MQAEIRKLASEVWTAHGFSEGQPLPEREVKEVPQAEARLPQAQIAEALGAYNVTQSEAVQIPLEAANAFYEDLTQVVNVSIDDVWVKKQKPHSANNLFPILIFAIINRLSSMYGRKFDPCRR
jgi:hypothetical protein